VNATPMSDSGTGAVQARVDYRLSKEELEALQKPWSAGDPEIKNPGSAQPSLQKSPVLKAFVSAFGNLINIFPPRRRREVYMPTSTVEEDIRAAWETVGRAIVDVTRTHGHSQQ